MTEPAGSTHIRSPELLSHGEARLLIVDVQQKLMPHIPVADQLIENCRKLIEGARILGVPVSATEQYPAGLGPTVSQLADLLPDRREKLRFSSAEVLGWSSLEDVTDRHKVIVAGIEAHVCVLQTALDLLAAGFRVSVPADAVASRHKSDWKLALLRLSDSGAAITSTEALLFELCEVAGTGEFKQISRLVTGR